MKEEVLIIGCGVSGLSTGIFLLKSGYKVHIWAKDVPPNTTSNKAAAVWYPYLCFPREKAIPWARYTFEYIQREFLDKPETGCILETMTEMYDKPQSDPWWKDAFPGSIERPTAKDLPEGYVDAYKLETIVIDTTLYMNYLVTAFQDLGGKITQKEVHDFSEGFSHFSTIVNCSGLGSKELCGDEKIYPIRGQMIKLKATGYDQVVVDDEGPNSLSLVVPRVNDIMIGGTAQEHNWNEEIDPKDSEDMLRKVLCIAPELRDNIHIVSEQVGLRPARSAVRLEKESFEGKAVIHNYGHGGAGFTLSWGCAQDVVDIMKNI